MGGVRRCGLASMGGGGEGRWGGGWWGGGGEREVGRRGGEGGGEGGMWGAEGGGEERWGGEEGGGEVGSRGRWRGGACCVSSLLSSPQPPAWSLWSLPLQLIKENNSGESMKGGGGEEKV